MPVYVAMGQLSSMFSLFANYCFISYFRCDDPVTVTITVQDKNGNTDWTHVFTSGGDVAIPGMTFSGAGLFVKVELDPENDKLELKV